MYSTSSLVAWLLFEFESELSLSHHPSTRFETTFRISDHLAEKTPFAALIEKQPADCIRLSDHLFNSEVNNRTCVFQRSVVLARGKGDFGEMMKWRAWSRESSLSGAQRTLLHRGT